jgi:hypothetical protein
MFFKKHYKEKPNNCEMQLKRLPIQTEIPTRTPKLQTNIPKQFS